MIKQHSESLYVHTYEGRIVRAHVRRPHCTCTRTKSPWVQPRNKESLHKRCLPNDNWQWKYVSNSNLFFHFSPRVSWLWIRVFRRPFFLVELGPHIRSFLGCFFDRTGSPTFGDLQNRFCCSTCLRLGSPRSRQKVCRSQPSGNWRIVVMLNGEQFLVRPSWPLHHLIIINSHPFVQNLPTYGNFWRCRTKKLTRCANFPHQLPSTIDLEFNPFKHICAIEKGQNTQERKHATRASWIKVIDNWIFQKSITIICLLLPTTCPPLKHNLWFPMDPPHIIPKTGETLVLKKHENSNSRRKSSKPRIPIHICRPWRISSARSRKKQCSYVAEAWKQQHSGQVAESKTLTTVSIWNVFNSCA